MVNIISILFSQVMLNTTQGVTLTTDSLVVFALLTDFRNTFPIR